MKYKQLTRDQRYQIEARLAQHQSQRMIANHLGIAASSLCREIARNRRPDGTYCAEHAHHQAIQRRHGAFKTRLPDSTIHWVTEHLALQWSPEQISATGKHKGIKVSHEWIYQYVQRDKAQGGRLYIHLRQGHRCYRKGRGKKRLPIEGRVCIEQRPEIVDTRARAGDWEVDTVRGKQGSGAIVTLAERKYRLYLIRRVHSLEADVIADATVAMLSPIKDKVHTITSDNGSEFAAHEKISRALEAEFYFAHPYSPWERGLNENHNGLLRQYVPKGTDLRHLDDAYLMFVQERLNNRPRKCLGYKCPIECFEAS